MKYYGNKMLVYLPSILGDDLRKTFIGNLNSF